MLFFQKFVARESSFHKSTAYKNKDFIKIFHESQINRKVNALVPDPGGSLKVYHGCQHVKICQGGCGYSDGEGVSNKNPLWNYL